MHIETAFFTIVFAPIAALLLLHFINAIVQIYKQPPWHRSSGKIEEAALQYDHDGDPFISVRFRFHVADQPYWGNQNVRVGRDASRTHVRERLPVGKSVAIDFDPGDPENHSRLAVEERKRITSI